MAVTSEQELRRVLALHDELSEAQERVRAIEAEILEGKGVWDMVKSAAAATGKAANSVRKGASNIVFGKVDSEVDVIKYLTKNLKGAIVSGNGQGVVTVTVKDRQVKVELTADKKKWELEYEARTYDVKDLNDMVSKIRHLTQDYTVKATAGVASEFHDVLRYSQAIMSLKR